MKNQFKNICLTINSLAPGGAEKQCLLLASLLKEQYNTWVVIIDDSPIYPGHLDFLKESKTKYIFLEGKNIEKIKTFRRFLKDNKIELIFSYLPKDIMISTLAGWGIVKKHFGGIRNALMEKSKIRMLKFFHNYLLDGSISNCASGKTFFSRQGLKQKKIYVIPNGIKIDTLPQTRTPSPEIKISTFGRLVDQKDFQTAIKAFIYLRREIPISTTKISLTIVGSGPLEKTLQDQIDQASMRKYITIISDAKDVGEILRQTDIYLCTSLYEGVSNAIMEAMAYSLPIVATDAGDNKLLVNLGENGFITALGDHIGIGNALKELIEDPEKRLSFGRKSYSILKNNHDLPVFKQRYLTFLNEL